MAIYEISKAPLAGMDTNEYELVVVLELFTSQGCSSCPPADALLDMVKQQHPNDVFALSYHVDYWNYIGWEDPFSKSQFSKKQSEYNTKFGYSGNYTPELVVNGKEHFVGSNAAKLQSKIKKYQQLKSKNQLTITDVSKNGETVTFNYDLKGSIEGKLLRVVLVLDEHTTIIKRGENRNRTLKNSNIVIEERYLQIDSANGSGRISIPQNIASSEKLRLIVIVEDSNLDIAAAAKSVL